MKNTGRTSELSGEHLSGYQALVVIMITVYYRTEHCVLLMGVVVRLTRSHVHHAARPIRMASRLVPGPTRDAISALVNQSEYQSLNFVSGESTLLDDIGIFRRAFSTCVLVSLVTSNDLYK